MSALALIAAIGVSGALFLLVTALTSAISSRHRAPTEARLSSIAGVEHGIPASVVASQRCPSAPASSVISGAPALPGV